MGSPLSLIFTNAFLCHCEKHWLSNCVLAFLDCENFGCYVDGIFVMFVSQLQLKISVNYFNKQHPSIKFTFEVEQEKTFTFLDINISHDNNKVTTLVYRKPTFSDVFTNFASFIHR